MQIRAISDTLVTNTAIQGKTMRFQLLWVKKWHQKYALDKRHMFGGDGMHEHDHFLLAYHTSEYDCYLIAMLTNKLGFFIEKIR